jgi:hypothetical protein
LECFRPYFEGHAPPPRPLNGPYNDADSATAATQIELATGAGIKAFVYFMYYSGDSFVMSRPMTAAIQEANDGRRFRIAGVWCIRLPHDRFPVPNREELEASMPNRVDRTAKLDDLPLELLTLTDAERLIGTGTEGSSGLHLASPLTRPNGRTSRRLSHSDAQQPASVPANGDRHPRTAIPLTLGELRVAAELLNQAAGGRQGPSVADVANVVTRLGLGELALETVIRFVDAAAREGFGSASGLPLKAFDELMSRNSEF